MFKHTSPLGGSGENRTPVHSAFTTKELQQFYTITYDPTHHELLCKSSKTPTVRFYLTNFLIRLGHILPMRL
jgi:hypothetical protein